jgi:hypothetical protein
MKPDENVGNEMIDNSPGRAAEMGMWLMLVSATVSHVYRAVETGSIFGGVDTIAFLVVAVLLLVGVRALRSRRP